MTTEQRDAYLAMYTVLGKALDELLDPDLGIVYPKTLIRVIEATRRQAADVAPY